tara:strand:+ start:44 stop:811 length:768 start_codon:yes stop_codon:yes gene_type:complete
MSKIYDIGIAHQKIIRDKRAETDKQNLFGSYWSELDLDLKKSVVREIDLHSAAKMIIEYEWLGCMPAVNFYAYGIFFNNVCGGVVVFGQEYTENLGVWDKYDYTGKILLLSRGVCLHWTPINTNSKLIMSAVKMLPEKYKIVTATTDHLAGEIGTIYQACNFYYVGSMRENNPNVNGKKMNREAWMINGKLIGSRNIRQKIGTQKMEDILKVYPDAVKVKQNSKHRYFLFTGTKRENAYHKEKIQKLILPYPKRK